MRNVVVFVLITFLGASVAKADPTFAPVASFPSKPRSSKPTSFLNAGRLNLFVANDALHQKELWATDGTESGTYLVKDISARFGSNPENLTLWNGFVYFAATDDTHGRELWKTDGTSDGTTIVADLEPGQKSSNPMAIHAGKNQIYFFTNNDNTNVRRLWTNDGTSKGTIQLLDDISYNDQALVVGNTLYFTGCFQNDCELWVSGGKREGTRIVKDIYKGQNSSSPRDFFELDHRVIFSAIDGLHGRELWISDGTASGTYMLKDAKRGRPSGVSNALKGANQFVYFSNGPELWLSNGTPGGTKLLLDFGSSPNWQCCSLLFSSGSTLFFSVQHNGSGELWKTDGTSQSTSFIRDLEPYGFEESNGTIFFLTGSFYNQEQVQLWKTDGTTSGTTPLQFLSFHRQVPAIFDGGTFLLFSGFDPNTGIELWKYDTTKAFMLKDIDPAIGTKILQELTACHQQLYFTVEQDEIGTELWRTDSVYGILPIADIVPGPEGSFPQFLTCAAGYLFFYAIDVQGEARFYRTDGTQDGTIILSSIIRDHGYASIEYHNQIIFLTYDPIGIWKSDGTREGTVLLKSLNDVYYPLILANDLVFFQGKDYNTGPLKLWKTDGTSEGTLNVSKKPPLWESYDYSFFTLNGRDLFFSTFGNGEHVQLWKTDGSSSHTQLVWISPWTLQELIGTVVGNELFFPVRFESYWQLWKIGVNGTPVFIKEYPSERIGHFVALNRKLLFATSSSTEGYELWTSDGTESGTHLLKDIFPGQKGSGIRGMFAFYNAVLFLADDGKHGVEPWITDGTSSGTRLLIDLRTGPKGSHPKDFTKVGKKIYFTATAPSTERQLWYGVLD